MHLGRADVGLAFLHQIQIIQQKYFSQLQVIVIMMAEQFTREAMTVIIGRAAEMKEYLIAWVFMKMNLTYMYKVVLAVTPSAVLRSSKF